MQQMDIKDAPNFHKKAFKKATDTESRLSVILQQQLMFCGAGSKMNGPVRQNHAAYGAPHFMVDTAASVKLPVLTVPVAADWQSLLVFIVMGSFVSNRVDKLRFLIPPP